jgi:transposase
LRPPGQSHIGGLPLVVGEISSLLRRLGSRPPFTDVSGTGRLLGQVAGRTGKAVAGWLDDRGAGWKDQVKFVASDPCAVYRPAVERALPGAVIVVDHFHLVRLANQAVTKVRQRVTRQVFGRRGTTRDPAWANRRRLLRARERLTAEQFNRMWDDILSQEATGELLAAWIAREELRYLLSLARTRPPRSEISNRLFAFYDWCARADVPEVTTLVRTIEAWWPQILAFIVTGITNATTEATNRMAKDAARIAFGFRNIDNQRRRVRLHCNERSPVGHHEGDQPPQVRRAAKPAAATTQDAEQTDADHRRERLR